MHGFESHQAPHLLRESFIDSFFIDKDFTMQFIDKAKIKISSGKGGNGVVAWRREKFVDKSSNRNNCKRFKNGECYCRFNLP